MLKSRLQSTTRKVNVLNGNIEPLIAGVKALETANYESFAKEEGKIIISIETLEANIESLEKELSVFEEAEEDIQGNNELTQKYDAQIDKIMDALERGREVLILLKAHKKRLSALKPSSSSSPNDRNQQMVQSINQSPFLRNHFQVKIPKFKGVRWEWTNFYTIFNELVGKTDLSPLLKLNDLINHLDGEAKELVSGYKLTGDNYEKVLEFLKNRYDNKTATIDELNNHLMSAKATDFKIPAQRKLWDSVRTILDQLRGLGQETESEMLKNLVVKKFSYNIQESIYRAKLELEDDSKWTMEQIEKDIETTIKRGEYLDARLGRDKKKTEQNSNSKEDKSKSTKNSGKTEESKYQPTCIFCKGQHYTDKCEKVKTREEREKLLVEKKACKGCYRINPRHEKDKCDSRYLCKNQCKEKHHYSLCPKKKKPQDDEKDKQTTKDTSHANTTSVREAESNAGTEASSFENMNEKKISNESYLATIKTEAYNRKKGVWDSITTLIDCGANKTFIDSELMRNFDLRSESTVTLRVQSFGDSEPKPKIYPRTKIELRLPTGIIETEALVAEELTGTMKKAPLSKEDTTFILKKGLRLNEDSLETTVKPNMILGTDILKKIWKGNMVELPSGLNLLETVLGYATIGKTDSEKMRKDTEEEERENSLERIYVANSTEEGENVGNGRDIEERQKNEMSMKTPEEFSGTLVDEKAEMERETIEFFKRTVEKREDGYYVRIPFKNHEGIPSNRQIAKKRLISVHRYNGEEVLQMIDDIFNDQLAKNIIEPVEDETKSTGLVHYNPHQPVLTPQKTTTKCREVIDGSSHFKNEKSLNDIINPGPVILPDLIEMLVRFRAGKTVILSDVEKAFLQVRLHEDDRDATRVLWLKDFKKPVTEENIRVFRFTRVLFGLNVSPFLLGATIEYHLEQHSNRELANEISKNLYVDNLMLTTDGNTERALELYRDSKETFTEMNMNLREFLSNSKDFNDQVEEKDRAKETESKVLGISWSAQNDMIKSFIEIEDMTKISRRTVASTISGIFDPLGFLVPIILPLKLFQRHLWNDVYGWDTPVSREHKEEWEKLIEQCNGFKRDLPRNVIQKSGHNQLVAFTDASKDAVACCVYAITENEAHLIFAKSKVKPLKERWTIPKLEMQAISMGTQSIEKVMNALRDGQIKVTKIHILSDSEIALAWVRTRPTTQEVGVLVANRNQTIQETVQRVSKECPVVFGYVETKSNPADLGTRGMTKDTANETGWWKGPEFLTEVEDLWPHKENFFELETEEAVLMNVLNGTKSNEEVELVFDYERTNSLSKLKRIAAYVLKFVNKLKGGLPEERRNLMDQRIPELKQISSGELIGPDIETAMRTLVKDTQRQLSEKELKKWSKLRPKLNEHGVIVCIGRMENAELPKESREPILLTPECRLSTLMIWEAHGKFHKSKDHTISEIRKTTWIPKLRAKTKSILKKCVACQRLTKQPFVYPQMSQLPSHRVTESQPFENTGLDYFGPIAFKQEDGGTGKAYGAIFTCAATRLVHVEVVPNETTTAFIQAFRKFVSLRGLPRKVVSDNAPTFILGSEIITEASKGQSLTNEVKEMLQIMEMDWTFITPYAPWKGGFYERMVKLVKDAFKKGIGRMILNFEELTTTFYEVTASINSRPLTYSEDDIESIDVISPNDFIYQKFNSTLPVEELIDQDPEFRPSREAQAALTRTETIAALQSSIEATSRIWKIWKEKYLAELRATHKLKIDKKRGHPSIPMKGKLVFVCDEDHPRDVWRLGRVAETVQSEDGEIREVHLLVKSPLRKAHIIKRPPNLLVPLEIDYENEDLEEPHLKKIETESIREDEGPEVANSRYNLRKRKPISYNDEETTEMVMQSSIPTWNKSTVLTLLTLMSLCIGTGAGDATKGGIECTKTGLALTMPYENFEVCVKDYCTSRARMQWTMAGQTEIWIPMALKTRPHRAKAKVFNGHEIEIYEKKCPAVSACETIECVFCWQNITNPECSPLWAWIGLGGLLYCIGMILYCCCQIPIKLGGPIVVWWRIIRGMFRAIMNCLPEKKKHSEKSEKRKPSWTWRVKESLVILTLVMTVVDGCQEIEILTQKTIECLTKDEGRNCQFFTENVIHLNSIQQEACIRMSHNGTNFQEIRARYLRTNLRCMKESVVFTRETQIKSWSTKRCPRMGSCTDEKCSKINRTSMIPELEHTNGYVGTTGCVESCGGPGCDCFFLSSACLFYRIYAVPQGNDIFEIFKCVQWEESLVIEVAETSWNVGQTQMRKNEIELFLNQPTAIEDKTFIATTIVTTPSPLLSTWFVRNKTEIATWQENEKPAFYCSSEKEAIRNDCQLQAQCNCDQAETEMRCACKEINLTSHFNTIQQRLPIRRGHWELLSHEESVIATSSEEISSAILIKARGEANIEVLKDEDTCTIEDTHIVGCYACAEGGQAKIHCKSKKRTTIATIQCGERMMTATCSPNGHIQNIRLFSNKAQFIQHCSVSCGGEAREFQVTGILKYTRSIWTSIYRMIEGKSSWYDEVNLPDLSHLFDGFWTFFKTGMIVVLVVVAIFATTYLTVFSCCATMARKTIWIIVRLPYFILTKPCTFFWKRRSKTKRQKLDRHMV